MKDSGVAWIGEIPDDWQLSKIGALFSERNTRVNDTDYQPLSVTKNGIVPQLVTAAKTDNNQDRKLIKKGDFVINSRSDRRGSCGISEYDGSCSLINTVLQPNTDICSRYYDYVFHTDLFADEFYAHGHGIVDDLWSTKWSDMKRMLIPLPAISNQIAMASFLETKCSLIDEQISNHSAITQKLKEYKQSLITETVIHGLDSDVEMKDSGILWIGSIPAHWEISKLRSHTHMLTPMRDRPEDLSGPVPWVRIEDYDGKYIEKSKEGLGVSQDTIKAMNLKVYPVGSVLCTSSCDLGKCAVVSKEIVSNQRFINIIPDSDLSTDYLYYLMLSNAERLNQLSTGTIQANLSRVEFEHLLVQFPPLSEQLEISSFLDKKCNEIDSSIAKRESLIAKLTEYKKSLIYEVVTGKKEV